MSQLSINSNLSSLKAQRRNAEATDRAQSVYERLSSGLRINRASDDAAGLSISSVLNSSASVYLQGIRNFNDGLSVLSIADSTIGQLSQIATQLKELAEQAANGTYGVSQRKALDRIAQSLAQEFFRVSRSAKFNGRNLFDGSILDGLRFQGGYGIDGSIHSNIGGALGDGTFRTAITYSMESSASNDVAVKDINGDGYIDMVTAGTSAGAGYSTVRLGNGDGTFQGAVSYANGGTAASSIILGDLNNDGIMDMITGGTLGGAGGVSVRLGNGDGTFGSATSYAAETGFTEDVQLGDLNGDGFLDLVSVGNGRSNIRLAQGNGTFGAVTQSIGSFTGLHAADIADLNGDNILDIVYGGDDGTPGETRIYFGRGNGTFSGGTLLSDSISVTYDIEIADVNGDGVMDLIGAGPTAAGGGFNVRLGNGNGTFKAEVTYAMATSNVERSVSLGDVNGDGILDVVSAGYNGINGFLSVRLGNGDGTFGSRATYSMGAAGRGIELADVDGDGVLDVVSAQDGVNGYAGVQLGGTRSGVSPIVPFSLQTMADARQAIPIFDSLISRLGSQRGVIGAFQSRLAVASDTLMTARENYLAAASRIQDADIAQESSELVRTRILQDVSASVLAQANQIPALAISLLTVNDN